MTADLNRIAELADQVAASFGLTLVDVKIGQQGRHRTIEVTIFKPAGRIGLDDCEKISRQLELELDNQSPPLIEGSFSLEVQSPGTDRKLCTPREFELFSGQMVEVKTKQAIAGLGAAFTGKLMGMTDGQVLIQNAEKMTDKTNTKKAKTAKADSTVDTVQVELSNVIYLRLIPETAQKPPELGL